MELRSLRVRLRAADSTLELRELSKTETSSKSIRTTGVITVHIVINGETTEVATGTTVLSLLERLEKDSKYLAVEVNQQLVSRKDHAACCLQEGDRVEIVTLVGGG